MIRSDFIKTTLAAFAAHLLPDVAEPTDSVATFSADGTTWGDMPYCKTLVVDWDGSDLTVTFNSSGVLEVS